MPSEFREHTRFDLKVTTKNFHYFSNFLEFFFSLSFRILYGLDFYIQISFSYFFIRGDWLFKIFSSEFKFCLGQYIYSTMVYMGVSVCAVSLFSNKQWYVQSPLIYIFK
jgi:hypothetical protein